MRFSIALGLGALFMLPGLASAGPCTQPAWEEIRSVEAAGALGTPYGFEASKHYRRCLSNDTSLNESSRDLHRFRLLKTTLRQSDYDLAHSDLEYLLLSLGVQSLIENQEPPAKVVEAVDDGKVTFLGQVAKVGAELYYRSPLDKDQSEYFSQLAMLALEPSKDHQPGYLQAGVLYHLSRFSGDPSGSIQALVDIASSPVNAASAPGVSLALRQLGDLSYARGNERVRAVCAVPQDIPLKSNHERLFCYEQAIYILDSTGKSSQDLDTQRDRVSLSVNGLLLQSTKSTTDEIGEGALALSRSIAFFSETPSELKTERGSELQIAAAYRLGRMLLFSKAEANQATKNAAIEVGLLKSDWTDTVVVQEVIKWLDIGPLSNTALEMSRRSTMLAAHVVLAGLINEQGGDPTLQIELAQALLRPDPSLESADLHQLSKEIDISQHSKVIFKRYPENSLSRNALSTGLQGRLNRLSEGESPSFTYLDLFELDMIEGDNLNILLIGWAECQLASLTDSKMNVSPIKKKECVVFCEKIWAVPGSGNQQRSQYFQSLIWTESLLNGQSSCLSSSNL